MLRKCFRKISTPKLVRAEPKNTGVSSPLSDQLLIEIGAGSVQKLDLLHELILLAVIQNLVAVPGNPEESLSSHPLWYPSPYRRKR